MPGGRCSHTYRPPVGRDQLEPRAGGIHLLQASFEVRHVVVAVPVALRLAEPDAVDDARVVELVADDGVLFAEERLEQAAVGVEAGAEENRLLGAEELREAILELLESHERTILFSTHITSDLERVAQRVAIMGDGKIRFYGELDVGTVSDPGSMPTDQCSVAATDWQAWIKLHVQGYYESDPARAKLIEEGRDNLLRPLRVVYA